MKHCSPTGRRNHGNPLKRVLDTWDRNGSTSDPTPWQIYDDDDDESNERLESRNHFEISGGFRSLEFESTQLVLTRKTVHRATWQMYRSGLFNCTINSVFLLFGVTAPSGPGPPHSRGFYITLKDTPQSVGLLWTNDQLVAETSTGQHTTIITDEHPCGRWDSNPKSQQASGRRPTP